MNMKPGYFKIGNGSCHIVSDTPLLCIKSMSLPYPSRVLTVSMLYLGIISHVIPTCVSNTVKRMRKYVTGQLEKDSK